MMKKLLALSAISMFAVGVAGAGELRDNVGAGLGSMIFEGQSGLIQQVLAATTNGSCGNQTFAISSGTLGAKQATTLVQNEQLRRFVADNMDNLARDMAIGRGESLDTLTELMGIPAAGRAAFEQKLQANFGRIYSSPTVTHLDVIQTLASLES